MSHVQRFVLACLVVVGLSAVGLAAAGGDTAEPPSDGTPPPRPRATRPVALADQEKVFREVAPCRLVDTRLGGGPVAGGATRTFAARGATGFPAQGGKAGGCGIPTSATSLTVSITALGAPVGGFLRLWPTGQPEPSATVLNYAGGSATTTGATVVLGGGAAPLTARPSRTTDLVIDVTGYFSPQAYALVDTDGSLLSSTSRIVGSQRNGIGTYTVTLDGPATDCAAEASVSGGYYDASATGIGGNDVRVLTWQTDAGAPTSADLPFSLTVTC